MRLLRPTFLALAGIASCGEGPPADSAAQLSPEASAFVDELCAITQPCCATIPDATTKCVTDSKATARGKAFDPVKGKACLDGLRAESKGAEFCRRPPDVVTCGAVFKRAATEPGRPCKASSECANADGGDGLCVGTGTKAQCRVVSRGKDGDACFGTRAEGKTDELVGPADSAGALCFLTDGLVCDTATKRCARRGDVGATCTLSAGACVDQAFCPRQTRQCVSRTARGGTCEDSEQCVLGHRCGSDGAGGAVCLALAKAGEPCPRGDECDPSAKLACDSATAKCKGDAGGSAQTCSGTAALAP